MIWPSAQQASPKLSVMRFSTCAVRDILRVDHFIEWCRLTSPFCGQPLADINWAQIYIVWLDCLGRRLHQGPLTTRGGVCLNLQPSPLRVVPARFASPDKLLAYHLLRRYTTPSVAAVHFCFVP